MSISAAAIAHTTADAISAREEAEAVVPDARPGRRPSISTDACAKFTTFVALKTMTKPIAIKA